jgi:phosphatidylserine/phosphatidylglycerophosphate/cardiolipin synthase-like enzyme/uncharacterized membrane protein YdjX (TVP38/TMEM64 family)
MTHEKPSDVAALQQLVESAWNYARADRLGWCIDGEDYFAALRSALDSARREILIIGWDVDSRVELIRDPEHPMYPSPLADTLEMLAESKPELRVQVLAWDFSMVFMLERELLPARAFGWQRHRRMHFELDNQHAPGASHHQKLVVIDACLAFIGGIDLTRCRWDTRAHLPNDARRLNPDGEHYPPFHDVQAVVSGAPAADLRELAALRWASATGETLVALDESQHGDDLWPESVPCARDVPVAIARTWNGSDGSDKVFEIKESYLQLIKAAQDFIYIENQYFSATEIVDALAQRLGEDSGPDIVVVLPLRAEGWLEQATMDMLRNRAIARLRDADRFNRLRICAPVFDELCAEYIMVHSKLMIVDGRIARIGSANISERSMGLDTESDLIFADEDAASALCAELLAEHLGADVKRVAELQRSEGLLAVLDRFGGNARHLQAIHVSDRELEEALLLPVAKLADMEAPIMRTSFTEAGGSAIPLSGWLLLLVASGIIGFWLYSAIIAGDAGWDPGALLGSLRSLTSSPYAALAVLPAFVIGSFLVAPVTAMVAICALLFEPWIASVSAITGILLATAANHWVGSHYHNILMQRVPDAITDRIDTLAASSDALTLAGLRLIPIAPFTLINIVVGASGVGLRDFLIGTLIALGPVTLLICLSVDRARAALAGEPVFDPWIILALAAAGAVTIGLGVRKTRRGVRDSDKA